MGSAAAGSHLHVLQRVHWRRLFVDGVPWVRVWTRPTASLALIMRTTSPSALIAACATVQRGCARASRNVSRARVRAQELPNNCNFHGKCMSMEGHAATRILARSPCSTSHLQQRGRRHDVRVRVRRRLLRPRLQSPRLPHRRRSHDRGRGRPGWSAVLRKAASYVLRLRRHLHPFVPRTDDRGHQLPRVGCGLSGGV